MENRLATPRHLTLEDRLLYKLPFAARIDRLDQRVTAWMARYGLTMMRVALGIVFFWFGALKLVPGLSPAEDLVRKAEKPAPSFNLKPNPLQPDSAPPALAMIDRKSGSRRTTDGLR